jgi:hypothetical protein
MGPSVIADLDTLLIALYVGLTDRIIPARSRGLRRGPGRPSKVTDAELVCLAVAQVLLRYHDEHHWLRAAPSRVGHLAPRLLSQSACNRRLRQVAWLLEAALRWLADHTPDTAELLRLLDGTPVVCGRIPAGLWVRVVQRLHALDAAIWSNWQIGAPVKRSLIAYDH